MPALPLHDDINFVSVRYKFKKTRVAWSSRNNHLKCIIYGATMILNRNNDATVTLCVALCYLIHDKRKKIILET